MPTKNFEIGQVVYILSEQAQTILPGLVVEECVVKTIAGNSTSWKIKVGLNDKSKLFDSAKIKGELYGSLDEVKSVMTDRLTNYVNDLGKEAQLRVEKWYGKEIADREKSSMSPTLGLGTGPDDRIDPDVLLNSLEETTPKPKFVQERKQQAPVGETMKERLKRLAIDEEEVPMGGDANGQMFFVDADGVRLPIRMPQQ